MLSGETDGALQEDAGLVEALMAEVDAADGGADACGIDGVCFGGEFGDVHDLFGGEGGIGIAVEEQAGIGEEGEELHAFLVWALVVGVVVDGVLEGLDGFFVIADALVAAGEFFCAAYGEVAFLVAPALILGGVVFGAFPGVVELFDGFFEAALGAVGFAKFSASEGEFDVAFFEDFGGGVEGFFVEMNGGDVVAFGGGFSGLFAERLGVAVDWQEAEGEGQAKEE